MGATKDHRHTWAQTAKGAICTDCSAEVSQAQIATVTAAGGFSALEQILKKAWKDNGEGSGTGHGS